MRHPCSVSKCSAQLFIPTIIALPSSHFVDSDTNSRVKFPKIDNLLQLLIPISHHSFDLSFKKSSKIQSHSNMMSLLQFVAAVIAFSALLGGSGGRELRPSEHGLEYQELSSPPPEQEMLSFFGATTATVELPEAKNISDTWLGAHAGRDHVRLGLLVATAVCGLTGVVLLAISGVVFLFRLPKTLRISSTSPLTSLPPIHAQNHIGG